MVTVIYYDFTYGPSKHVLNKTVTLKEFDHWLFQPGQFISAQFNLF